MNIPDLSDARWRKSSHSSDTGGDCVEIADLTPLIDRWRKSTHSSSTGGECVEVADLGPAVDRWRKSSHSGDTGGDCVEVADVLSTIAVRDSKNPSGPALALDRTAFATLISEIRAGAYEL